MNYVKREALNNWVVGTNNQEYLSLSLHVLRLEHVDSWNSKLKLIVH